MDVTVLCDRLSKYHWSPEIPGRYVIPLNGRIVGVGRIAKQCPAAFNLVYSYYGDTLWTEAGQRKAVDMFTHVMNSGIMDMVYKGYNLETYILLYDLYEFDLWYRVNRENLPREAIVWLDFTLGLSNEKIRDIR